MKHTDASNARAARRARTCALIALLAIWASCSRIHLRQGWDESLGPVVPHDTFPADCTLCHMGTDWNTLRPDFVFDHEAETGVPLTGSHQSAQCLLCHNDRGPVTQFAAKGCAGCHVDVHLGHLGPSCDRCHTEDTWRPNDAIAAHNRTRFPLIGAHAGAECYMCHEGAESGVFLPLDTTCQSCHLDAYVRTTDPDHDSVGFGTNCQDCHTALAWEGAISFTHPSSFPLTAAHGGLRCDDCHVGNGFGGLSTDCVACHLSDFQSTNSPNHAAAGFPTDCEQCHNTTGWTGANFVHTAAFPLNGGHHGLDCFDCHTGGVYTGLSSDCVTCHLPDYQATNSPNHTASGFSTDCDLCHTIQRWEGAQFNHPASFPLSGGHAGLACADCHTVGGGLGPVTLSGFAPSGYSGLSTACASCHSDDFSGTTNPNHNAAGFSTNCEECHTINGWTGVDFNHTQAFPLSQGHAGLDCQDCHTGGVYTGLSSECVTCHLADYQGTTNPNHATSGFNTDCEVCHTTQRWRGANFDHPSTFPLTAGHSGLDCQDCHTGGVYTGLSTSCSACHQGDYNATTNPNHGAAGFSTTCDDCHTTSGWTGVNFNHTSAFPLTGGHGGLDCSDCHLGGVYTGLSSDCVNCHLADYQGTTNPNHSTSGFNTDCDQCHNTTRWTGATFNHPSSFPLTNGHGGLDCFDCHVGGVYTGLSTQCNACHNDDYTATTDPRHSSAGFNTTCQACHNTSTWGSAAYTHTSAFPLVGRHAGHNCNTCHGTNVYHGLPSDCVDCHLADYQGTTNPNHTTSGFGTDCALCHMSVNTWNGANFSHPASFPLTNGHSGLDCFDCHVGGVYTGLSTQCNACHNDDYTATTDPRHASAGFNTVCQACHNTTRWDTAAYTHTSAFPLTGGHAGHNCNACHGSNVYHGLPSDCVTCHLADYQGTTNPNHQTNGFSTDCEICHHSNNTWQGATFSHPSSFPLTNGHAGLDCTDCHVGGVYTGLSTQCNACHNDDYTATTDPRHASAGFNTVCQACHNTTRWDTANYTHTSAFPLTNGHAGHNCNACHGSNVYHGLPSDCASCHIADYNATTDPDHGNFGFPTDCELCHHSTSTWSGATFNHQFPINSGAHRNLNCSDCHTVPGSSAFSCIDCHEHRQSRMDDKHSDVNGYVWQSQACYSCHPNGRH
ncbi:MAG: hypothetical protein KDA20_03750 [Phycisphaerales bacterium]|nr:hypothetical protein [Phycisphaerales bacterium]